MQKERNMSDYIDFIAYQDDAIIQRTLRYYRRRGQPHPQPKGDLHQGNRHQENGTHHDEMKIDGNWDSTDTIFAFLMLNTMSPAHNKIFGAKFLSFERLALYC